MFNKSKGINKEHIQVGDKVLILPTPIEPVFIRYPLKKSLLSKVMSYIKDHCNERKTPKFDLFWNEALKQNPDMVGLELRVKYREIILNTSFDSPLVLAILRNDNNIKDKELKEFSINYKKFNKIKKTLTLKSLTNEARNKYIIEKNVNESQGSDLIFQVVDENDFEKWKKNQDIWKDWI